MVLARGGWEPVPWPRCAAADGERARSTGPQPMGKGQRGQAVPGGGSGREQNGLSPSGGKARRGAGARWGLGLQECRALPSTGKVQAEPGQCRQPALPDCPVQQHAQPCPGAKHEGAWGSPAEQGLCKVVPTHAGGLSLGRKGRCCPAPRCLVRGGSCPHCRQPQPRWDGQAAGSRG